jgi:hypothetical protein
MDFPLQVVRMYALLLREREKHESEAATWMASPFSWVQTLVMKEPHSADLT